jgi:predicted nicotinamide N-methyase
VTVATVTESVDLRDGRPPLRITRPASSEDLIDEHAFAERDEYLPYWAELWPSAITLARVVAGPSSGVGPGSRVLELGCGLALPALAAARAGADVLATDWSADAVNAAAVNARAAALAVRTAVADWRDPAPFLAAGPFDLVLAADVAYEARAVAPLLALLSTLAPPRVLLADPSRATAGPLLSGAREAGWSVTSAADAERPMVVVHELRRG